MNFIYAWKISLWNILSNVRNCLYSLNKGHPEKSKGTNIIAILPGTKWGTKEDRINVVGAHWDSVEASPGIRTL